jgi:hypothetical protein
MLSVYSPLLTFECHNQYSSPYALLNISKVSVAVFLNSTQNLIPAFKAVPYQTVGRWLPTAVARVPVRTQHVEFVVDKAALEQVSSEYFGFSCQSFHQFLHHHNQAGAGTLGRLVGAVPSAPNWTLLLTILILVPALCSTLKPSSRQKN